MRFHFAIFALLAALSPAFGETPAYRTVRELNAILSEGEGLERTYLTTGVVRRTKLRTPPDFGFCEIEDTTGRLELMMKPITLLRPGDVIELTGVAFEDPDRQRNFHSSWHRVIGHAAVTPPVQIPLAELDERQHDLLTVITEGRVVDIVPDEIDANYSVLLVKDRDRTLPCFVDTPHAKSDLLDARIRFSGRYHRLVRGERRFSGPYVEDVSDIRIVEPAAANRIDMPPLDPGIFRTPRDIAEMDRRSMVGRVLATWDGRNLMLRVGKQVVNATLAKDTPLPKPGDVVRISGYPETDLFRIHLGQALWRADATALPAEDPPETIVPEAILIGRQNQPEINSRFHGRTVRLAGLVRTLPDATNPERKLYLDTGSHQIPVDFSSCPSVLGALEPGCRIAVTGSCRIETNLWQPHNIFPQIGGFSVVMRHPSDIEILARPAWWTPARLTAVIGVILAGLLGAFAWVFALHRLAERRGRELFEERQAHEDERRTREIAEVRMQDRTRLAVELHDTISQNLTGATMQMGTAAQLVDTDRAQAVRHIDIATRTLDSCREELRNCIWDLRNNALDVPDLNEAIRMTIQRLLSGVDLQIRFNIPRAELSDNTVHALMRIVRELATNAVRHGKARTVRVAGALEGEKLHFSVTDDGTGFDPENRPGLAEGHFGLQGIEERVAELGGEMRITSGPESGTRVAIWIRSRF